MPGVVTKKEPPAPAGIGKVGVGAGAAMNVAPGFEIWSYWFDVSIVNTPVGVPV